MPSSTRVTSRVILDGRTLTPGQVAAIARGLTDFKVSPAGMVRVVKANSAAIEIARTRPIYGQTTAVGSKRSVKVAASQSGQHISNLLRSHGATAGPNVDPTIVRAMMVVRLNQLLAGGSGVSPQVVTKLHEAVSAGLTPPIRRYNALGTGDLGPLSVTALCLLGEKPWEGGTIEPVEFTSTDPMAFISSSALTQAEAAVAACDLSHLVSASLTVGALSFLALGGSPEIYAAQAQTAKPHAGQSDAAQTLRSLLDGQPSYRSGRVQDPYSLRALPQVHGAALESVRRLNDVIQIEINSAGENPLIDVASKDVYHNGNFHTVYLALALDNLAAAVYQTAGLSAARSSDIMDHSISGFRQHLASGADSSYGLHILEYIANSALSDIRRLATPSTIGGAVFDNRAEEHASFSPSAAWSATQIIQAFVTVLSCELVTATRALKLKGIAPEGGPLARLFQKAARIFGSDFSDQSLDLVLDSATDLIKLL